MMFKSLKISAFFCLLFFLMGKPVCAQNVLDDFEEEERTSDLGGHAPNLATETIKTISSSKKIFIITNEGQTFTGGDFISLLTANKLVCRALVAKTTNEKLSGIKIVKVYNLALWKQLREGKEILVLKGDDSYYTNKEKAPEKNNNTNKKDESKIQSDEDLFNSTSLSGNEDDLSMDENNKRLIRPDNLVSANIGLIDGQDVDGAKKKYTQMNGAWTYQVADNFWSEIGLGTNTIRDYPSSGLDTRMVNIEFKAKYTFSAPFYSYIQPYVGYQTILATSPGAGEDPGDGTTAEQLEQETQLVDDLKKSSIIFGATILKRIVPGWFLRVDLGTDIINGGLTIEF